ncbi:MULTISPECIES: hypothetical protein [Halobacterium]|uniref:hypothetical protein n=1 Tax=Halobacterium TaxID=2239 RepID=UPI0009EB6F97|nr:MULTISPECIES: hypothetical protein [Halobacterium]MCG1002042.1 hypothetical protein [Halobacterium noricense]
MEIVSTMGSGSLGQEVDLETLVAELKSHLGDVVEPDFNGSGMVTVRLEEGGPAYTTYRTGAFQIRGAEDRTSLMQSFQQFERVLADIGLDVSEPNFTQATSVFVEDLGREVNLEELALTLGLENIEYEPEQFPGLIYRPPQFETTLIIFSSGKVTIGGTTDRKTAKSAIIHLCQESKTPNIYA